MPLTAGFAELLFDLAVTLADLRVPWYVFGAQAALMWGRPRLTTDVDVTVRLGRLEPDAIVRALAAHGGWDKWALRQTAQYHWEQTNRGTKNVWETRLDLPRARVRIDSPTGDVAAGWDGTDAWADPPSAPVATNARFSLRTELFWFSLPWKPT